MEKDVQDKEEKVYELLDKLRKGDNSDKSLAYECESILSNEAIAYAFEDNLNYIEELIDKHYKEKDQSK